jgi:hypothetical protein
VYVLLIFLLIFSFDWCIVLSCLFVCFVCLCPMIDALRVNVVGELWRAWRWRYSEQLLWLKASVWFPVLITT